MKNYHLRASILTILLAVSIMFVVSGYVSEHAEAATLSHTKAEAVQWCKNKIGKAGVNYDNFYGVQCVDLIREYSVWLGKDLGIAQGNGAAYIFATRSIPTSYYTRYSNNTTPAPGDIFVWAANAYGAGGVGHVGVIYEVGANYYKYIDYNSGGNGEGAKSTTKKDGVKNFTKIIRPNFKQETFTVKFNANGGKGTMENINVVYGVGADISKCSFTKDYYKFAGWNVYVHSSKKWVYTNGSKDGAYEKGKQPSGYYLKVYKSKVVAPVSVVDKDTVELFAVWKPGKTFTVKFNANGGKGTMANINVVYGVGADVSVCNFKKDYYKFVGWNAYVQSSKKWVYTNGSNSVQAEKGKQPEGYYLKVYKTRVTYVSDVDKDTVELFAVWEPGKTFTVKFNANGGKGTMADKTVIYGVGADVSKCSFTKDSCTFVGWNAYVQSSKKWVYTNGSNSVQAEKGKQPEGYYLKVYKTRVTYVSDVDKDIVELYAVWESTDPITTPIKDEEQRILNDKSDEAPAKSSSFSMLQLRYTKAGKSYIKVKWTKVKGAASYYLYGAKCGQVYKKLGTFKKQTYKASGLKKGKYYKFYMIAADAKGNILAQSKTIHVATTGGKIGNYGSVKLKNVKGKTLKIKKGKSFKIKASAVAKNKKLKVSKHRKLAFESSNPKVAKVNSKGKITAKKAGTAKIYVYSQSGTFAVFKVKVTK